MKNDDVHPVFNYFSAIAIDRTPQPILNDTSVFFSSLSSDPNVLALCASVLTQEEIERAARFITADLSAAFIQRRAFRRFCAAMALNDPLSLDNLKFVASDKGQPVLSNSSAHMFSFSSCADGMLGAWSTSHAVGVDIEVPLDNFDVMEMAKHFFSQDELHLLEQVEENGDTTSMFYELWCLKEAALKTIGEGLPFGLDQFSFQLGFEPTVVAVPEKFGAAGDYKAYSFALLNAKCALVTRALKNL